MKDSGTPEVGDLVVAKLDERRGLTCYGTVLECRQGFGCTEHLVLWSSESLPMGWWKRKQLRVITGEKDGHKT